VTEFDVNPSAGTPEPPATAGALLREARESAGLTVDTVAQQLKLAPRQVRAIEESDFTHLPGRTFVRGFVRNYARLLRLDSESVLGALPATVASTLDSSALQPTAPSIGELPTTENGKTSWTRWAIPLTLVAIIGAAVAYEQMRVPDARRGPAREAPRANEPAKVPSPVPEIIGTPLPNPMTTVAPASTSADAPAAPATGQPASASTSTVIPSPAPITEAKPSAPVAPPPASLPLVLTFRDFSWTEIKDRNGTVVLSRMNPGGTTQAIAAAPPLDLVIGNAVDVALTWRGQRVDLTPHTRQNVARLRLQ